MATSKELVQDSFEARQKKKRKKQEKLAQTAEKAQQMAETLFRAQKALSKMVQKRVVLETRP